MNIDIQRCRIRSVPFLTFFNGIFWFTDFKALEREFQIPVKIFYRGNIVENLIQPIAHEPLIGFPLQVNQMRHWQNFFNFAKAIPGPVTCLNRFKHVGLHSLLYKSGNTKLCTLSKAKKNKVLTARSPCYSDQTNVLHPYDMAADVNHYTIWPL